MHFFSLWLKPDEIITLLKITFSSREISLAECCISFLGSRLYNRMTNFFISFFKISSHFPSNTAFCYEQKYFLQLHLEEVTYDCNRKKNHA